MTGRRAAATLVALAALGPAVAIVLTLMVDHSLAGDSWAHDRLVGVWVLCAAWPAVCLFGSYTEWRHRS